MNNYRTTAGRIARWYLTEWEQHERARYRLKLHALAAGVGALLAPLWAIPLARVLGF